MTCVRHILFLLTAMSTNPWSHSVASEITQHHSQNQSQDYYESQEIHELVFRNGNESNRMSQRYIIEHARAQVDRDETRTSSRDLNGSYKILNGFSKSFYKPNRPGQTQEPSLSDRIVFPGPTATYSRQIVPEIPNECKKWGICEAVPNYPDEEVNNIVSQLGENQTNFQIDELDLPETPDIAQRLGPQEDNMELCSFREKVMYPEALPDNKGKWHLVINPKSKPVQGFRVEICEKNKSPCAEFVSFQSGYEAQCLQKYVQRHVQVLDEDGNMVQKSLKVPSCCSCIAKLVIR